MIYLDNAATTLRKPPEVIDAVVRAMQGLGNPGRGGHAASLDASRAVYDARSRLARLFGADSPARIAFTPNSTAALNIAVKGLLSPGDHVITTAMEHNSVLRPLYELRARGVELTILPADEQGRIDYADFDRSLRANTRAIVCTHGSNLTGNLVDIARIGALARSRGVVFIVDASQTAGVFPIDMRAMYIDILCFTGHKALLAPQGTGGIALREGVELRPLITGGSGVQTYSQTHPAQMPVALEAGTLNSHGVAGLAAALGYIEKTGMDEIRRREQALTERFYRGASAIPGVKIYGDFSSMERCPIVSLNIADYDSAAVSDALQTEYAIATRPGGHCAPLLHRALGTSDRGAVRFSFSHFNTMDEIDRALAALRELARP